jgi:large subunit ribosomal protein L23
MALFSKKKEEKDKKEQKEVASSKDGKKKEKEAEKREVKKISEEGHYSGGVLIEPWITEKSHILMSFNKYVFRVDKKAGKVEIGRAVESLYNVKTIKAAIVNIPAKKRMRGAKTGWKSGYKKAVVTLKEGDKIELFKGV